MTGVQTCALPISGVPETFLIDKQGVIRRRLIGASWTVDDQRTLLKELIAEQAR